MHLFSRSLILLALILTAFSGFFLFRSADTEEIRTFSPEDGVMAEKAMQLPPIPEPDILPSEPAEPAPNLPDIPPQLQLQNPPSVVKGIYVTGWVAGGRERMRQLIDLLDRTELNTVVLDIKDYSGYLSYRTGDSVLQEVGAESEPRISNPSALIKDLHDRGIYVIGRITVFQDSVLAKAHPDWALMTEDGEAWRDRRGLMWMDPAAREVWDYNVRIAKDAFARGFDEINFDYIRFPSDGDLSAVRYPRWDGASTRQEVIASFFRYLREELGDQPISGNLFGLAAIADDDLGIGQVIEDAYPYFDHVMPMVYPSHYASGFLGYPNPADYPYEVISDSLARAVGKWRAQASSTSPGPVAKLRPWLQAFDLGAKYDSAMVARQIQAAEEVLERANSDLYSGWVLWDPSNIYASYPRT